MPMLRWNLARLGFALALTAGLVSDPALAHGSITGPSLEQLTRGERPLIVGHVANFARGRRRGKTAEQGDDQRDQA